MLAEGRCDVNRQVLGTAVALPPNRGYSPGGMTKLRIYVDLVAQGEAMELLRAGTAGHQLVFAQAPGGSNLAPAGKDPQLANADVAFGQPDPETVSEAGLLKWLHVSTSGITRYDTPAFRARAAQRRLLVTNSVHVYNDACAVHLLSFILAQARKLPLSLRTRPPLGGPVWSGIRSTSGLLRGETMLILGYGAIARRLTELLRPFDLKVTAFRRNPRGDEGIPMVVPAQLSEALAHADHVVNILPESAETRLFFNSARFALFKPGTVFYNIGRGATVDQNALLEALRSQRLAAAWLDVTDPEPLPEGHPLLSEPSCFITPHVAGGQPHEAKAIVQHFLDNLARFVCGEPLRDRVM